MQKTLHIRTTVLPGGRIEIVDQELPVGESVSVVVHSSVTERRSAVEILKEAPGQRLFRRAEELEAHRKDERASWEG